MFERRDANNDGFIDASENRPPRNAERMFSRVDTDGSGGISAEEYAEAQSKMGQRRQGN